MGASPHAAVAPELFYRDYKRHSLKGDWLEHIMGFSTEDGAAWSGVVRLWHVAFPETVSVRCDNEVTGLYGTPAAGDGSK